MKTSLKVAETATEQVDLRGINVLILTSGHRATDARVYAREACSLADMGATVTVVAKHDGADTGRVRILPVPAPGSRLVRFLWQPWRCIWRARKEDADIVHLQDAEMLITLPVARLIWHRAKFVYDVHEDFGRLVRIRNWLPSFTRSLVGFLTNAVEKGLALLADGIVAATGPLADRFTNKNRIAAYNFNSRNLVALAKAPKVPPHKREFDLVHLGTLSHRRALFLTEVLREFHLVCPGVRSMVIGVPADFRQEIEARIPEGCTLIPWQPYAEIPALLANAKVGLDVHPWQDPHLEVALPVKVCEYMAAGCAVVTSAMKVLCNILAEGTVDPDAITVINGGLPKDYARAAAEFVRRIDEGEDPGATLQRFAFDHMAWEKEAAKLGRFYLKLLEGNTESIGSAHVPDVG